MPGAKIVTEGGAIEYAKEILNKAFGVKRQRIYRKNYQEPAYEGVRLSEKVDPKHLLSSFKRTSQTVALILSHIPAAEQASAIIAELPRICSLR